jgi:hypothetical protein
MDPFTYARAAASLGRNCLSTFRALYNLHAKYATVRKTVEAFHGEIAAIGISMQYINGILEQNSDLAMAKFYHNPHVEQTFSAAIAGCNLVLSCLDEEVEKIQVGMGPEGSKGRKGKARWLWKEETMNGLLQTLRGQHSAIFSIVQCLQVCVCSLTTLPEPSSPQIDRILLNSARRLRNFVSSCQEITKGSSTL